MGVEFSTELHGKDGLLVGRREKIKGDVGPGRIEISQLDAARKYNFTILAIRFNGSKDARISSYKLIGKTESAVKEMKTGIKDAASFAAANFEEYIAKFENDRTGFGGQGHCRGERYLILAVPPRGISMHYALVW